MFSRFIRSKSTRRKNRSTAISAAQVECLECRALLSNVTIDLNPSQDGTLYEDPEGAKANGAGIYFFTGPNATASRRGVIQFDIASMVPEGSVITDVTLTLHNSGGIAKTRNVFLHPITTEWSTGASDAGRGEYGGTKSQTGDATWLHSFHEGQQWASPGGDYDGTSAATLVTKPGYYDWSDDRMVDIVQQWLDEPETNNGWLIRSNENARSVKRFDSSEHHNPARRPVLTITYEPPVELSYIEGRKWHDVNVNGRRELDEPWLNGWTIELTDAATGEVVERAVNRDIDLDGNGSIDPETERGVYSFTTAPGRYTVSEVQEDGWAQSYPGYATDFGREGQASVSGAMSSSDSVLYFDFDVDNPNRNNLRVAFFVSNDAGELTPVRNVVAQRTAAAGRVVGDVRLTPDEIGAMLQGKLTAGLINTRDVVKASGPVEPSGAHKLTLSEDETIIARDFANYRIGGPISPIPPSQTSNGGESGQSGQFSQLKVAGEHGIHFGLGEEGRLILVLAPQSLTNLDLEEAKDPEDPTQRDPRHVLALLKSMAKRDTSIAEAVDRVFGSLDPFETLG